MNERIQAQVKPTQKSSFAPSTPRLLQRKCACGGTAGISGECKECSKKKRFGLQSKLKVNKPGDIYEQEADRIVDQVMSTPVYPTVSGAPSHVPRSSGQSNRQMDAAPASVDEALASPGTPLEPTLRQDMEQRFGHDFSNVRVHSDAAAEQSAQDVNAHAYTVGQDIVFDAGRFAPGTHDGRRLIAHELTHVVQQAGADRIYADRGNEKRGLSGLSPHVPELGYAAQQGAGNPVGAALLQRQVRPGRGRKGKTEHTGGLSAPNWGNLVPMTYGTVEVRTGEEIELKGGTKIPNMIALEYTGLWSRDSKWLQFVWFEEFGTAPNGQVVVNAGQTIPAQCGTQSFTTVAASPNWGVDSGCDNPFYEAGGTHIRTSESITIFDDPGGLENSIAMELANRWFDKYESISSVTWTAHFETYLIQSDMATYLVSWQASATFTRVKGKTVVGAIGYTVHSAGSQEGLPRDRKTLLDKKYPSFKHVK